MKNITNSPRLISIGFCSAALLLAVGTAPILLTGCGDGGSSGASGANVTNATAPASLPAGVVATGSPGTITFTDSTHYTSTSTVSGFTGTGGTYAYSGSGTTATLTLTPNGDASRAYQLSNFTVNNGRYATVVVTPPSSEPSFNQPASYTFSGTAITYTAPASNGGNSNAAANTPVAGSVYRITARSGNSSDPAPIGMELTIEAVTSTSFTIDGLPRTLQADGSYKSTGTDSTDSTYTYEDVFTFSSGATILTHVTTTWHLDETIKMTYTLTKQ